LISTAALAKALLILPVKLFMRQRTCYRTSSAQTLVHRTRLHVNNACPACKQYYPLPNVLSRDCDYQLSHCLHADSASPKPG